MTGQVGRRRALPVRPHTGILPPATDRIPGPYGGAVTDLPWPPGAATGVGSLPGTDPAEAVRVVLGELPDLPHLPELPARGLGADMIGRGAALLVDLPVDVQPSGWRLVDRPGRDARRAADLLARDLDALEEPPRATRAAEAAGRRPVDARRRAGAALRRQGGLRPGRGPRPGPVAGRGRPPARRRRRRRGCPAPGWCCSGRAVACRWCWPAGCRRPAASARWPRSRRRWCRPASPTCWPPRSTPGPRRRWCTAAPRGRRSGCSAPPGRGRCRSTPPCSAAPTRRWAARSRPG